MTALSKLINFLYIPILHRSPKKKCKRKSKKTAKEQEEDLLWEMQQVQDEVHMQLK
jgi:hypothetical protein